MTTPIWVLLVVGAFAAGLLLARRGQARRLPGPAEAEAPAETRVDMRVVVDGVPRPAVLVSREGRIEHANAQAAELAVLVSGRSIGDAVPPLGPVVQRALAASGEPAVERIVAGDPPRTYRTTVVRAGAEAIVSFDDVTDEADFEEARRTFSAAVSHELRTPLARILGLAETLALPDIDDDRDELVAQIELEVEGIRKLIDEMLLLAALDRGRLAVADGIVDGTAVVHRVVADAAQRRIGRGRVVRVDADDDVEIPVAARLFEVVVQNLVDNALIHGGPDAEVDVRLQRIDDMAALTVADSGRGIPAQHLPFVFQRFYRGDASRTGSGTGLGLALVKHIVEAHGGTVTAESDGATGAEIRVTLPLEP